MDSRTVFTRGSYNFGPRAGKYTGPGYGPAQGPVYPSWRGGSWQSNTSIELSNIVYPDGTPRVASAAQSKLVDSNDKEAARVKIEALQKQANAPGINAARRAELVAEIEKIQQQYFAAELALNEMRAGRGAITISAEGHARAAERQRQEILDELRRLTGRGLPPPPPAFSTPATTPAFSTPAPAASSPMIFGRTPEVKSDDESVSAKTGRAPAEIGYPEEDKAMENIAISAQMNVKPIDTQELIDMLSVSTNTARKQEILKLASEQLDQLPKSDAVVYRLYQLALLSEGLDPNEYSNMKIDRRVTKYKAILGKVRTYKNLFSVN